MEGSSLLGQPAIPPQHSGTIQFGPKMAVDLVEQQAFYLVLFELRLVLSVS